MKQIVDKLNKIAKKIDESVEIPQTDLIIDSLDAITKAYGGTPNDSNLIVDKLEDIYNNIGSVPSGNIEITENGENINVAPYATATVNVASTSNLHKISLIDGNFVSADTGSSMGYAIFLQDTLVCAIKDYHLVIDNVEVENLDIFPDISPGQIIYGESVFSPKMLVSSNIMNLNFAGTGIVVPDTEPTTHHIEFYYYSEFPYAFQFAQNIDPLVEKRAVMPCANYYDSLSSAVIENKWYNIIATGYSYPIIQYYNPNVQLYPGILYGDKVFVTPSLMDSVNTDDTIGGTINATTLEITYATNNGIKNNIIYYTIGSSVS